MAKKKSGSAVDKHKIELLEEAMIIIGVKTLATDEDARKLWGIWQEYTGRTATYRNCSVCVYSKVKFLKKEYKRLKDGEQNSKKNTVPGEASGDVPGEQQ